MMATLPEFCSNLRIAALHTHTRFELCNYAQRQCPSALRTRDGQFSWAQNSCIHHARFMAAEQPWPQSSWPAYKIGNKSTRSAGCEWLSSVWLCVGCNGTKRYWRCCWLEAQTSPCPHSSQRRIFWTFTATYISQSVVNSNELTL